MEDDLEKVLELATNLESEYLSGLWDILCSVETLQLQFLVNRYHDLKRVPTSLELEIFETASNILKLRGT